MTINAETFYIGNPNLETYLAQIAVKLMPSRERASQGVVEALSVLYDAHVKPVEDGEEPIELFSSNVPGDAVDVRLMEVLANIPDVRLRWYGTAALQFEVSGGEQHGRPITTHITRISGNTSALLPQGTANDSLITYSLTRALGSIL